MFYIGLRDEDGDAAYTTRKYVFELLPTLLMGRDTFENTNVVLYFARVPHLLPVEWSAMLTHWSRPIWPGKPAFLSPPPWF